MINPLIRIQFKGLNSSAAVIENDVCLVMEFHCYG
uniref:Uncharacterized protein n=1 Tax=Populus trichocarpa TaxID=3694 RepID=A0A3N7FX45_POPTR